MTKDVLIAKINPMELVIKRRSMFIASEGDCSVELAKNLLDDALTLGAKDIAIKIFGKWFVVHSSCNWLETEADAPVEALFRGLYGLAGGGLNAFRREILVTAFCQDVFIGLPGKELLIKGAADEETIDRIRKAISYDHSYVAFRYET